jgi:hypothetical protein
MRVYHMINSVYGIESIKNQRLKIAKLSELNDLFELMAIDLSDDKHKLAIEKTKEKINKKLGILCFSDRFSNPLMWSHYADKHKGIALGFDIPMAFLTKVVYTNIRPKIIYDPIERKFSDIEEMKSILIGNKFIDWKYESEYRMAVSYKDSEKDNNLCFLKYEEIFKLKEIILGVNCCCKIEEIKPLVMNEPDMVQLVISAALNSD